MRNLLVFMLTLSLLVACNSGDNNNQTVTGLSLPKTITVIDPADTQSPSIAPLNSINRILPANFDSPGTDFSSDSTQSFVAENALLPVQTTNLYLCIFDQLNYLQMVNQGPYTTLVDYSVCWQQVLGYTPPSDPSYIVTATVISERSSNSAAHVLKVWLPTPWFDELLFDITIYDSADTEKPFGEFVVTSATVTVDNEGNESITGLDTYFTGIHDDGKPYTKGFSVHPENTNTDVREAYTVAMSAIDSGAINSYKMVNDNTLNTSSIEHNLTQFNPDYILAGSYDDTNQSITNLSCSSRQEYFRERTGYTLYHANDGDFRGTGVTAGERVQQKLFLFFDYNGVPGNLVAGQYYLYNGEPLPDGAIVSTSATFDGYNAYSGTFTAHVTPASLAQITHETQLLSDLKELEFIYQGNHPQYGQLPYSWIVKIDQNNDFQITQARISVNGATYLSETIDHDNDPNTAEVPVNAALMLSDGQIINLSTDRYPITSHYTYTHNSAAAPQDRTIETTNTMEQTALSNDLFSSNANEVTFYCYIDCPIGGVTQANIDNGTSAENVLYYNWGIFQAIPRTYTLQLDNLRFTLIDDSNGLAVDASQLSQWQISSKLLTAPLAQPATLQNLDQVATHYEWSTSADSYNQSIVLTDEVGMPLTFDDQAMRLPYTFDAGDDVNNKDPLSNPYHGKTFVLDYLQSGGLFGFPEADDRYEVNLETGTLMSNGEGEFVVKPLYEFQYPLEVGLTQCNALDLADLVSNPDLELMTEADLIDISFGLNDKPETNKTASKAQ